MEKDLRTDLCKIQLMEAPFNGNNKKVGKDTMSCAEHNNLISPEQYGSRKGKMTVDHALHKTLTYDIMKFRVFI